MIEPSQSGRHPQSSGTSLHHRRSDPSLHPDIPSTLHSSSSSSSSSYAQPDYSRYTHAIYRHTLAAAPPTAPQRTSSSSAIPPPTFRVTPKRYPALYTKTLSYDTPYPVPKGATDGVAPDFSSHAAPRGHHNEPDELDCPIFESPLSAEPYQYSEEAGGGGGVAVHARTNPMMASWTAHPELHPGSQRPPELQSPSGYGWNDTWVDSDEDLDDIFDTPIPEYGRPPIHASSQAASSAIISRPHNPGPANPHEKAPSSQEIYVHGASPLISHYGREPAFTSSPSACSAEGSSVISTPDSQIFDNDLYSDTRSITYRGDLSSPTNSFNRQLPSRSSPSHNPNRKVSSGDMVSPDVAQLSWPRTVGNSAAYTHVPPHAQGHPVILGPHYSFTPEESGHIEQKLMPPHLVPNLPAALVPGGVVTGNFNESSSPPPPPLIARNAPSSHPEILTHSQVPIGSAINPTLPNQALNNGPTNNGAAEAVSEHGTRTGSPDQCWVAAGPSYQQQQSSSSSSPSYPASEPDLRQPTAQPTWAVHGSYQHQQPVLRHSEPWAPRYDHAPQNFTVPHNAMYAISHDHQQQHHYDPTRPAYHG